MLFAQERVVVVLVVVGGWRARRCHFARVRRATGARGDYSRLPFTRRRLCYTTLLFLSGQPLDLSTSCQNDNLPTTSTTGYITVYWECALRGLVSVGESHASRATPTVMPLQGFSSQTAAGHATTGAWKRCAADAAPGQCCINSCATGLILRVRGRRMAPPLAEGYQGGGVVGFPEAPFCLQRLHCWLVRRY